MIHGLTPRLAEGGKIKIGGLGAARQKRGGGGTYRVPEKHDYFTVTTCEREGGQLDGDLILDQPVMDALVTHDYHDADGKIRTIPIVLHSDDLEQVFPTAYIAYQGKRMACRGDGQTGERREVVNGEWTGKTKPVDCPCELLEENSQGVRRCKHSGILHCSIAVPGQSVAGSVYKWRTTSRISCEQMLGSLLQILRYTGTLQGFPLVLRVRPIRIQRPTGNVTVYVCHVELREALIEAQRQALEVMAARGKLAGAFLVDHEQSYAKMLELPGGEDETEQDNVGPEFFPDAPGTDKDRDPASDPMVPPPHPPPSTKRKNRTRCKVCKELAHGVKDGQCDACRALRKEPPAEPPPEQPEATERSGELPLEPPSVTPPAGKPCKACRQHTPLENLTRGTCPTCTPPAVAPGGSPMDSQLPSGKPDMMCQRCPAGPFWPAQMTFTPAHGLVCGECVVVLGLGDTEPERFACTGGCGETVTTEGGKCQPCALAAAVPPGRPGRP